MFNPKRRNNNKFRNSNFGEKEEQPPDNTPHIGTADTSNAGTKVYLVKLPKSLYEKFANPNANPNQPLGRLRIDSKDKNAIPKIFIDSATGGPPQEYHMNFQPEPQRIAVFSEARDGVQPQIRVEGRVSYQCSAEPRMDARYRKLNRDRVQRASTKTRVTMVMDDDARLKADNAALQPQAGIITAREKDELKKLKEASRKHLDIPEEQWRDMAKAAVYRCFETDIKYTAERLARECDEPISRLRSVLNEVCQYSKSGAFAGHYILKEELMTETQRQMRNNYVENWKLNLKMRKEDRTSDDRGIKKPRMN